MFEPDQAPFPDTAGSLRRFRRAGLRLGVVSNAWPSLERRYEDAGLRGLFDVFVISALVGMLKPEPGIYRLALAEMANPAAAVAFVDDDPGNVAAATECGMIGVVMDRYGAGATPAGLPVARDLSGLAETLGLG